MYDYCRLLLVTIALAVAWPVAAQEPKGWLGADIQDITKAEADQLGWDTPHSAKVGIVAPGSPAEKAGLKAGDVILSVDRTVFDSSSETEAAISAKRPGAEVRLQVLSRGRERRVTVTLAERPKAQALDAGAVPQLMLDTGGHMGVITGLAFAPNDQLVSAGDDKVIRVWDLASRKTVRTVRGEVARGPQGKIYALALSSGREYLAASGWMTNPGESGHRIRLYDFASGRLLGLLAGHQGEVLSLAFSPDGRQLISGSADRTAIVWDVATRKPVQGPVKHGAEVSAVAFMPKGARVVTGSYDGQLRLWHTGDSENIAIIDRRTAQIRSLAVARDGMIATGSQDGEIRLWDGTGTRTIANQGTVVASLSLSPDGKHLLSGVDSRPHHAHVFELSTGRELATYKGHDNAVVATAISPDGRFAATAGGNTKEIHLWDLKTGTLELALKGEGATGWATGFSTDGELLAWGKSVRQSGWTHNDYGPLEHQIRLPAQGRTLEEPKPSTTGLIRGRLRHGSYELAHRKGGHFDYEDAILDVLKDGQVVASIERDATNGGLHRSYSFSPDGTTIISGGQNGALAAYDLNGRQLGNFIGHESHVYAVAPSSDGRLLASASADQTVRLWNLKTRELIVTLFHGTDGEWVMWTPQGYYTGSPGADKIVGWQINKGPDKTPDYVGAEQLRQHLNRPDIVEKAIILASAERAVHDSPGTTFQLADLLKRPVPRFRIVSSQLGASEGRGRVSVKIALEATPDPVKAIRVQVNGRQVDELTPPTGSGGFSAGERTLYAPLATGRNDLRITLTNAIGEKAETLTVQHEGEGEGDLDKRGTLYLLAIGIDKYPGLGKSCGLGGKQSCDLRYAGADARKLAEAVEKRLGPGHTNVVKRVLVNGAHEEHSPTASNIIDAIDMLKQAKETDTVLVFIAGHGINDGPHYRFLPTNAELVGQIIRGSTVVQWQVLQAAIEGTKGRRILFVDTCHSGNAYNQRLGNAAYHANIIAYTAARFDQLANESAKLGHGLFTYAAVEALQGRGEFSDKRQISTKELGEYLVKRVDELAKELNRQQEPQFFRGRDAQDYVLARW